MTALPDYGTVIVVDRLFDGHHMQCPEQSIGVHVRNGRIGAVGPAAKVLEENPQAARDYFDDATLSPGFIDSHVHLTMPGDGTSHEPAVLRSPESRFRSAAVNLRSHLQSGVTTVRDLGSGSDFLWWKPEDPLLCPRMIRFGPPMTAVGGHMRHFGGAVDGVNGARQFVYQNASNGADGLKIVASGGGSRGTRPYELTLGPDVVAAAIVAAHDLGLRTTVHAMAAESVDVAIAAGTDGIEHVAFLDPDGNSKFAEDQAGRAKDAGIAFGSTLGVNYEFTQFSNAEAADPEEFYEQLERTDYYIENARKLRELGTELALGSDAGWKYTPFGGFFTEVLLFDRAGFTPLEILHNVTQENARHIGMDHLIGELEEGKLADLTVLRGDPSANVEVLHHIEAVYRDGQRVYGAPSLARPRSSDAEAATLM